MSFHLWYQLATGRKHVVMEETDAAGKQPVRMANHDVAIGGTASESVELSPDRPLRKPAVGSAATEVRSPDSDVFRSPVPSAAAGDSSVIASPLPSNVSFTSTSPGTPGPGAYYVDDFFRQQHELRQEEAHQERERSGPVQQVVSSPPSKPKQTLKSHGRKGAHR